MNNTLKCKCSDCGALVEQWIGMVCVPCHDMEIEKAFLSRALKYAQEHGGVISDFELVDIFVKEEPKS